MQQVTLADLHLLLSWQRVYHFSHVAFCAAAIRAPTGSAHFPPIPAPLIPERVRGEDVT